MSETFIIAGTLLLAAISLFFWIRGLLRVNMGDLIAGLAVLLLLSSGVLVILRSTAAFNGVGGLLIVYGVGTFLASHFTKDNRLFKRRELVLSALLFIVVGFCGLIVT